jgi:hypothetical protein
MELVALSGVYMRLIAECLVHTGNNIADVCIIWSGFMLYLVKKFVRCLRSMCLACIGLSDGYSDQQLLIIIFLYVSKWM